MERRERCWNSGQERREEAAETVGHVLDKALRRRSRPSLYRKLSSGSRPTGDGRRPGRSSSRCCRRGRERHFRSGLLQLSQLEVRCLDPRRLQLGRLPGALDPDADPPRAVSEAAHAERTGPCCRDSHRRPWTGAPISLRATRVKFVPFPLRRAYGARSFPRLLLIGESGRRPARKRLERAGSSSCFLPLVPVQGRETFPGAQLAHEVARNRTTSAAFPPTSDAQVGVVPKRRPDAKTTVIVEADGNRGTV